MSPRLPTAIVALAGAAAATLAGLHPTGTSAADAVLTGGLALVVTGLAALAPPALVLVVGAIAAATGEPLALGLATLTVALTAWHPAGLTRVVAGACLANALLHLAWPDPFGATAAIASLVIVALAIGAWPRLPGRQVVVAGTAVLSLGVVASAGLAATLLQQRSALTAATDAGEAGLAAARAGDTATARADFLNARRSLVDARRGLGRWWVRAAHLVPVVAQNADAIDSALDAVADLADRGIAAADASDPSHLQTDDGGVDLAAVSGLRGPLRRLELALNGLPDRIAGRSGWVAGALTDRTDDLLARAADASHDVTTARRSAEALPRLLGADGERRYFLAVMTTSELRAGGGVIGNWGIVTAKAGHLALTRFGRIDDLYRRQPYRLDVDPDWNARYIDGFHVASFPGDLLSSPDLPAVAEAVGQLTTQAGEGAVDGMLVIDPIALGSLLELTGPVDVPGWGEPMSSANTAETLLYREYLDADNPTRAELLSSTTQAVFTRLTASRLPRPEVLARTMAPQVASGHLQFTVFDDVGERFLRQIGFDRSLHPPDGDSLAVLSASESSTKLDWFLHTSLTYDVRTASDGTVTSTVTVHLRNDAPDNLPGTYFGGGFGALPVGVNRQLVSVYSPLDVANATLDGRPVELFGSRERGFQIHETYVTVRPGETATLVLHLRGRPPGNGPYRLTLRQQPTVHPIDAQVTIDGRTAHRGPLERIKRLR